MPSSILISWSIRSCIWIISSLAAFKASDLALQHGFTQHSCCLGLIPSSGGPALYLCTFLCHTLTTSLLGVNCTAYIMSVVLVMYPVRLAYLPFTITTLSPQPKGCSFPFIIIFFTYLTPTPVVHYGDVHHHNNPLLHGTLSGGFGQLHLSD